FISLHVGDPGTTGANEVLVATDADYIRKAVVFGAAADGQAANSGALTWTADVAATTYDVTHIGIWDTVGPTGGNFLIGGALAVPEEVVASGALVLGIGRGIAALT
ncbi:MAG: hypothetical protein AB7E55_36020, partial [Pigmentiphaga sp.]